MKRSVARALVAAALLAGLTGGLLGCSEDGDGGGAGAGAGVGAGGTPTVERTELADEIAAAFTGDHAEASSRQAGSCFADALLDAVDVATLREAGVIGDDGHLVTPLPVIDPAIAEEWVDAQQQCSDFVDSSAEALAAQSKGKVDRAAYATCLRGALTEEQIRAGLLAAVTGQMQDDAVAVLSHAQGECAAEVLGE